jgi:hypothetical protein
MTDWPPELPQSMLIGVVEELPDLTLRTQMSAGAAKVRRKHSSGPTVFKGQLLLTTAQAEILTELYTEDLESGALPFNFTHPRTGVIGSFRFVSTVTMRPTSGTRIIAALELELLP